MTDDDLMIECVYGGGMCEAVCVCLFRCLVERRRKRVGRMVRHGHQRLWCMHTVRGGEFESFCPCTLLHVEGATAVCVIQYVLSVFAPCTMAL